MPDPTFTEAPAQVPSRAAPSTFSALTDPFIAWEKTFRNELSSSVSWFALQASNAADSAGAASDSAGEAAGSAGAASDSADDAALSAALSISGGAAAAGAAAADPLSLPCFSFFFLRAAFSCSCRLLGISAAKQACEA